MFHCCNLKKFAYLVHFLANMHVQTSELLRVHIHLPNVLPFTLPEGKKLKTGSKVHNSNNNFDSAKKVLLDLNGLKSRLNVFLMHKLPNIIFASPEVKL